jgi:hypothetical protein
VYLRGQRVCHGEDVCWLSGKSKAGVEAGSSSVLWAGAGMFISAVWWLYTYTCMYTAHAVCRRCFSAQDFTVCLALTDCSSTHRYQGLLFRGRVRELIGEWVACCSCTLPACSVLACIRHLSACLLVC